MKARNANIHTKVASVGQCHFLRVQLFQAIHVLRPGRPCIRFNEPRIFWILLLGLVVNAGRAGVEEIFCTASASGFQHVHANGGVVKAQHRFVADDKAHPTHVRSKIVHLSASVAALDCNFKLAEVPQHEFVAELRLFHELVAFPVHHYHVVSVFLQTLGDVRADKPSSSSNTYLGPISWRKSEGLMSVTSVFSCHRYYLYFKGIE
mmetsp:Transcript_10984/g.15827  ORF Transcript_10984/g.15827 Transcript_10984/m.15827 type:complete len:206 (-) Transcript_10984:22-639(-)